MLSLSAKSIYGLRATLLLAEYHQQGRLSIREIAGRRNIPRQYLEQIFNRLTRAGIIKSVRGKFGGYQLARPPADLKVSEIIAALEGAIELAGEDNDPADVINELLGRAEEALTEVFSMSLAELAEMSRRKRAIINFTI